MTYDRPAAINIVNAVGLFCVERTEKEGRKGK